MAPFNFKSYNHFITSSNGTTLQVYELTKPMVHPFSIRKTDWKEVANINISLEDDDDVDDDEAERMSYDGLLFFDGHGGIEGSKALTMLAQHLKRLRLLVNPEGYCFQESGELADYADFGIHYLRLNDLFSWPHHGVELAMITVWSRLEMKYHVSTSKRTKNDGVNLQKKLEELKKLLKERDEELEKLNEELEEAKEKLVKKKDDEKKDEIARVKKEVEQYSKSSCSWTMSPSVKYLPASSEGERVHLTRRRPVPPETFAYYEQSYDFVSSNMPRIEACLNVFNKAHSAQFVDEQNTGWPIPSSFKVLIGKNNRGFDKHNWWFAKANHPEGGLTMLAYYDGNYSKFSSGPDRTIQLPFLKDATLAPFKPFFLLKVHSFGVKLVFMYRV
ncbi:hypothetical protein LINPERPRIM_LOCUS12541 [Linum perenne]